MSSPHLLSRLQDDSPDGPVDRLAHLLVDEALERPVAELLPPSFLARAARELLSGWLASPKAEPALAAALETYLRPLTSDARRLGELLPEELSETFVAVLSRPFTPNRELVAALLEPEPVRKVIRGFVLQVVTDFGRRLRAPVTESRVARGLGGIARFAAEQAKAHSGAFGAIAGAVSDEVERQVEKRATEFVDSALSGILARLADDFSNPANARSHAALRAAILESALEVRLSELVPEVHRADIPGAARIVREALTAFLARDDAQSLFERAIVEAQRHDGSRPIREVLSELGLLEAAHSLAREALRMRLAPVFRSPAFATWLEELTRS
ncbi:MAG: hypothetical protein ACYC8T_37235 [Myxococcaceae bacterium]